MEARHDGWTPERQADFIGMPAETRSVLAAARFVSMRRESAYKLHRRPGSAGFAAAWDIALGREVNAVRGSHTKITDLPAGYRIEAGFIQLIVYADQCRGFAGKTDSSGLLTHLARLDRIGRAGGADA